ncbi:DUF1737 domain-containing protein [Cryptosporangium sp. NPDC051539]|uniref:DUF1737 domain-containing protein n=1 Tax=Cryptosporangium sp. NPDC051539 TaxID=3363962 RepID=UPI0037ACB7DB
MIDRDLLPTYRLLSGPDDSTFCYRVSDALDLGYELHSGPALTVKDGQGYVAQALIWRREGPPPSTSAAVA